MLPIKLNNGAVEALKWTALLAMVVDHIDAVFYARELGTWATIAGRIAFPVFAIVLAYNLARPGVDPGRVLRRLLVFGLLAIVPHAVLFGGVGIGEANIMFTFVVAVGVIELCRAGRYELAGLLFVLGGALVEYLWPGVAVVVGAWYLFRHPSPLSSAGLLGWLLALGLVNGSQWALLSIPLVLLATRWPLHLPRSGRFFWWFYPAHLTALALLSVPMG